MSFNFNRIEYLVLCLALGLIVGFFRYYYLSLSQPYTHDQLVVGFSVGLIAFIVHMVLLLGRLTNTGMSSMWKLLMAVITFIPYIGVIPAVIALFTPTNYFNNTVR